MHTYVPLCTFFVHRVCLSPRVLSTKKLKKNRGRDVKFAERSNDSALNSRKKDSININERALSYTTSRKVKKEIAQGLPIDIDDVKIEKCGINYFRSSFAPNTQDFKR